MDDDIARGLDDLRPRFCKPLITLAYGGPLTTRALTEALIGFLVRERRATEAAVAELDAAVPYPMTQVVADLEHQLQQQSFAQRVAHHLEHEDGGEDSERATGRSGP